uniref:Uncharacterized protein K0098G01.6 n=1 Tax=Oryza sativa subsp. indica TaxID=39946 RepID=C8TF80_ORYSI|nr:hypothetical protein [Oryza sativa Indica Group]BAI39829.1 hypothetical protein [Oryza sativa Indica Group]
MARALILACHALSLPSIAKKCVGDEIRCLAPLPGGPFYTVDHLDLQEQSVYAISVYFISRRIGGFFGGNLSPSLECEPSVLNFYGRSLLYLNLNSIAFLSIFAHLCEAYIGVVPFLDLFRFFYELRWMEANRVSGYCRFRLHDGMKARTNHSDSRAWTSKPQLTPSLEAFMNVISDLREQGLTGYEITKDFIAWRIQPLQARAHPAFDFTGDLDVTRISPWALHDDIVTQRVKDVLISSASAAEEPPVPLCDKPAADKAAAINDLPLMDVIGPHVDHQTSASLKEKVAQEVVGVALVPPPRGLADERGKDGHTRAAAPGRASSHHLLKCAPNVSRAASTTPAHSRDEVATCTTPAAKRNSDLDEMGENAQKGDRDGVKMQEGETVEVQDQQKKFRRRWQEATANEIFYYYHAT